MQNLKIIVLKNDTILISEVHQLEVELGEPDWKLVNPCKIVVGEDENITMNRWMNFSDQKEILIQSDFVLTVIEKVKLDHIELYLKTIK